MATVWLDDGERFVEMHDRLPAKAGDKSDVAYYKRATVCHAAGGAVLMTLRVGTNILLQSDESSPFIGRITSLFVDADGTAAFSCWWFYRSKELPRKRKPIVKVRAPSHSPASVRALARARAWHRLTHTHRQQPCSTRLRLCSGPECAFCPTNHILLKLFVPCYLVASRCVAVAPAPKSPAICALLICVAYDWRMCVAAVSGRYVCCCMCL